MASINILAVSNGVGITRDIEILTEIFKLHGHDVGANHIYRYVPDRTWDLNIFLERFKPDLFSSAKLNILIPNAEWFEPGWLPMLKYFHTVFTKTRFADDVFKEIGCKTEFISFTSQDRYLPDIKKDDFHYIHVAGKSVQKQTEIVIKTWENNPGFPQLTVVQDPKFFRPRTSRRNINFMCDRLSDDVLRVLQNNHAIHVCSSETEGFGHYIVEAMSCKSVVLVTNAPPMTELITPDRGMYIKYVNQEPMRLSYRFLISPESLEMAVTQTLISDDNVKREMGERARSFFLENDAFFRNRVVEAVANVLQ
jgi:glycosyltransferase involved in cell wall biosynthesis